MKKTILQLTAVLLLLVLAGCKADEIVDNGNTHVGIGNGIIFTLTAKMPGEEQNPDNTQATVRLSLTEDESKVTLTWDEGDEIYLVFVQGEGDAAITIGDTVSVTEVTNEGKIAKFQFDLPNDIASELPFKLYGVYGGKGLDTGNPTIALLPSDAGEAISLNDDKVSKNVMLYFKSDGELSLENLNVNVQFEHIGSLFKINLKNSGTELLENITGARLVGQDADNTDWAYNNTGDGEFNVINGTFESGVGTAGNYISFTSPQMSIARGETIEFWAWYPPHPDKIWPSLRLELLDGSGNILSAGDPLPSRTTATTAGRAFRFYALWNGLTLQLTDASFAPSIPLFLWDETDVKFDTPGGYGITIQENRIALTDLVSDKKQYTLSWTGDLTVGSKTDGLLTIATSDQQETIPLSTFNLGKADASGYYFTFSDGSRDGEFYFTE